jgi:predicted membrane channel-forming protein YqfA (hemolysin III family)
MDKEMLKKVKEAVVRIAIFASFFFVCVFLLKFYGECAAYLAFAVIITSLAIHSWILDKDFRAKMMESSTSIYIIVGWIFFLACVWIFTLTYCT